MSDHGFTTSFSVDQTPKEAFDFTKDKTEWTGTTISFDISEKDGQAEICFTHQGLVPRVRVLRRLFHLVGSLHQRQPAEPDHHRWRAAQRPRPPARSC